MRSLMRGSKKPLSRIIFILFILISFLGYYPAFDIPPLKESVSFAQSLEEKGEVISNAFSKPIVLPHPGYLSTGFSNYHPGIDIAAGLGMPVHPILDGVAIEIGRDIFGLGNYIVILHENGFQSKYGHLNKIYVKAGDQLTQENFIGEVGLTGHTSGPHTHLEITKNENYLDPIKLLPEIPPMPIAGLARK